ncbi:MAG: hypothetical protein GY797_34775 [Deltaproteobacteria bacterium]|nr:hypothetical protein [Deltaproteobacteria bacterium]MCP4989619.1 hypothetical protein [Colwellia sp.]
MTKWIQNQYNKHPFTWFTVVGTLNETLEMVQGFYDDLVDEYKYDKETGETSSPFYDWDPKKENIGVYINFGFEGVSIILAPKNEQGDYFYEWDSGFGAESYVATVKDVGGKPSYIEFVKMIEYLLSPIRGKVSEVDYGEVEEYCKGGRGYIVLTEYETPYQPLKAEMKTIGLNTPENFLEQRGYFGGPR